MKTTHKIFLAKLLYKLTRFVRRLQGKGDIAEVTRRGIRWKLDLREGIDLSIYLQGQFEPSTARAYAKIIKPGQTVLDIGANIGAHTLRLAELVGNEGTVIAFEPTEYAYRKLTTNLSLNPKLGHRVVAEQVMLGREDVKDYKTEIYSSWTVVGQANRHPKHLGELKSTSGASMLRLDSYLAHRGNPKVDFIKLDVDGYECEVLAGAESILKRDKPTICLELAPYVLEERGASMDQLIEILVANNYRFFNESETKELPLTAHELMKLIGDGAGINAIARSH
jgi:FkbM family methyltransferase